MIRIPNVKCLQTAIDQLDLARVQEAVLTLVADRLAQEVRATLDSIGDESHAAPWLRTGALQASISGLATPDEAVVGSTDPIAVFQELGTRSDQPRPFLGPVGATHSEEVARTVGAAVAETIRGGLT